MLTPEKRFKEPTSCKARIGSLLVDRTYQRGLDEARVKKAVKEFDPAIVEEIRISKREDGTLWIIDGQHTVKILLAVYGADYEARALIYEGLTLEDEASLFAKFNGSKKKPSYNDRLRASIASGNETAVAYKSILDSAGIPYTFEGHGTEGALNCHGTCVRIITKYGSEMLVNALNIIEKSWAGDKRRFSNYCIFGIVGILETYESVDIDRLIMSAMSMNSTDVRVYGVRNAPMVGKIASNNGGHVSKREYSWEIVNRYNKGLRKNRLDINKLREG